MGIAQIDNPNIAFSSASQDNVATVGNHVLTLVAAGTIAVGQIVYFTNVSNVFKATAAAAAQTANAGGVALTAATAGQLVLVCIHGIAQVQGGATVAAGAAFSAGASGQSAAASATIGSNFGIAIDAQSSGGALYYAFIGKL